MIAINEKCVMVHVVNECPDMLDLCVEALKKTIKPEGWTFTAAVCQPVEDTRRFYNLLKFSDAYYHLFIESSCLVLDELFFLKILACFGDETVGLVSVAGSGTDRDNPIVGCYAKADENGEVTIVGGQCAGGEIAVPSPVIWCIKGDVVPPEVEGGTLPGAVAMEYWLKGMRCVVIPQKTPLCLFTKEEESRRKTNLALLEPMYGVIIRSFSLPFMRVGRRVKVSDRVSFAKGREYAVLKIGDDTTIGDAVVFDLHYPVTVGRAVRIGRDAKIGRCTGKEAEAKSTMIDAKAVIESEVIINCGVTVGRGAQILAGSVVVSDIPPYVIAVGNPAEVVAVYDYESGKYVRVTSEESLKFLLDKRSAAQPMVTIGIPTYNRSRYLRKCLEAIFHDIGDDPQFEVLVSDNCSDDDTQILVEGLGKRYSNLRYIRNTENIGGAANFNQVYNMAGGKFVFSLGDDDYYNPGVPYKMLEAVKQNKDCGIVAMRPVKEGEAIVRGEGPVNYLNDYSYSCTWISLHGFRTDIAHQAKVDEKYKGGFFLQVVKQFTILDIEPKYAILRLSPFRYDTGAALNVQKEEHERLDKAGELGDFSYIFFHEYYGTLEECKRFGLTDEAIRREKKRHLFDLCIPWITALGTGCFGWSRRDTMKYYDEQYCDEPYYLEGREKLEKIVENDNR